MKALKLIPLVATACLALAYLAISLPLAKSAQAELNISSNPPIHNNQTVICNKIAVKWSESPSCPNGMTSTKSYATTFPIVATDGRTHTVKYIAVGSFCPDGRTTKPCVENSKNSSPVTGTVSPSHPLFMSVSDKASDHGFTQACGTYQQDYIILSVDGNSSCSWGSMSHPGGAGWCSTGVSCPVQHHNICQNNACVSVTGSGTSQCSSNSDCQPPQQHHFACVNNACISVNGGGSNECSQDVDCQPQTHLTCQNNACVRVNGAGQNTCMSNNDCQPQQTHLTVVKVVNNNHGGTKIPSDFVLRVSGTQVTTGVSNLENPGDYTVSEDSMSGYHQVSITGDCDSSGHVHLNTGDNKTCIIENEDNGSASCQMPTCTTNISGCSYPSPDTNACSCGPLVCITQTPSQNVTVNVNQQQQQQQEVLAASVAPATTTSQLPSTGAGTDILLSLAGLLPLGWKLRKSL